MDNDAAIAQEAEKVFRQDRENGFIHYLMVRTDYKSRADELHKIYQKYTKLTLRIIHSNHSYKYIKQTIKLLKAGTLDGIICVDMLGEGFDFPQLKIAAVHAPHKSLEVTLQFIGRFARTTADGRVGIASFLAVPSEIEIERTKLYAEGAIWQEIISELGQNRVEREIHIREAFETFEPVAESKNELQDLSLYSLKPYYHVKIYRTNGLVDLASEIELPPSMSVVYHKYSPELSATIFIVEEKEKPRWTHLDYFSRTQYDLFVIYYDEATKLLFINASRREAALYQNIASQIIKGQIRLLPLEKINKVIGGLDETEFFSIGMRNAVPNSNTESYRIITGPNAHKAVSRTDGRAYHRGHVFGKGLTPDEQAITIGYSSSSKVWSNSSSLIPYLIDWCRELAIKINSNLSVYTNSGLDNLQVGQEIEQIPDNIIAAQWHDHAFKNTPVVAYFSDKDNSLIECELLDLDVEIAEVNDEYIRLAIIGEELEWLVDYSLKADSLFTPTVADHKQLNIKQGYGHYPFIFYLNDKPFRFICSDLSSICGFEILRFDSELNPYLAENIETIEWDDENVDIKTEFGLCNDGKQSIQDFLGNYLLNSDCDVVFYDHGSGEIADFITFKLFSDYLSISLYHCKGAGGKKAGQRVDDTYEVCGQAVKSVIWTNNEKKLFRRLKRREENCRRKFGTTTETYDDKEIKEFSTLIERSPTKILKGRETFEKLEEIAKKMPTQYEIVIVQPGFTKANLPPKLGEVLAAAQEHIIKARCEKLRVMASK